MSKPKSIVLLSAGLDSTVNLYMAQNDTEVVQTVTFNYGQKAANKEIEKAKDLSDHLKIDHLVIDLPWFKKLGSSALTSDQLRLIKKYSNNLTILYDGDAAGVKAAMRGLDLALEEGLNVHLVLIPDNEDPDSYVNKVGVSAFIDFIKENKKDVILFQLEVMLKDAGNDSTKKANAVNTIAESISRMNKVEDFTRQQDYIHKSAELLKIDEAGLHSLVNKFIRERVTKIEQKLPREEELLQDQFPAESMEDAATQLLNSDEVHERALIRCLLDFGLLQWDETQTAAQYILAEAEEWEMIEHADLKQIVEQYKQWLNEGFEPTTKSFLFHEDQHISKTVVALADFSEELSPNWIKIYEKPFATRDDLFKQEIISVLTYLKLRKIKKMMDENQRDLEQTKSSDEQITLIKTHQHLKQLEMELTKEMGTVIFR